MLTGWIFNKSITIGIAPQTLFVSTAAANHAEKDIKIKSKTISYITYSPIHAEKKHKRLFKIDN
jgi:hypothetical protein